MLTGAASEPGVAPAGTWDGGAQSGAAAGLGGPSDRHCWAPTGPGAGRRHRCHRGVRVGRAVPGDAPHGGAFPGAWGLVFPRPGWMPLSWAFPGVSPRDRARDGQALPATLVPAPAFGFASQGAETSPCHPPTLGRRRGPSPETPPGLNEGSRVENPRHSHGGAAGSRHPARRISRQRSASRSHLSPRPAERD